MAKKSRRIAASYAIKSKVKKASGRPNVPIHYPDDTTISNDGYANDAVKGLGEAYVSTYKYVVKDLYRMGILIGGLAVILVVLTIFLR